MGFPGSGPRRELRRQELTEDIGPVLLRRLQGFRSLGQRPLPRLLPLSRIRRQGGDVGGLLRRPGGVVLELPDG